MKVGHKEMKSGLFQEIKAVHEKMKAVCSKK